MAARKPRIAFVSPAALVDRTSGAAISLATMLRQLGLAGWDTFAIGCTVFDRPPLPQALPALLAEAGFTAAGLVPRTSLPLWNGMSGGARQTLVQTKGLRRMQINPLEELVFHQYARQWLAEVRPDVVLTFGGLLLDEALRRSAKECGAAVAFYLANGSYTNRETFASSDIVLTNSTAMSAMYRQRLGIDAVNVGVFVDVRASIPASHDPLCVTLVNPVPEKGVALFLRLVEMARTRSPDMRFLVVESRGTVAEALQKLQLDPSLADRIEILPKQDDMREVYRKTSVLLCPSLWFEAAGRVLVEANANGIPVIAANRGGIPATLGGAGVLLDVPAASLRDHWHLPTDEEIRPWWEALSRMHTDPVHREAMGARALEAGRAHDIEAQTRRLDALLKDLVGRTRNVPGRLQQQPQAA